MIASELKVYRDTYDLVYKETDIFKRKVRNGAKDRERFD